MWELPCSTSRGFHLPDHRRQMIAAGAGAGLAAAFNALISGVLFVVEELLQDLSVDAGYRYTCLLYWCSRLPAVRRR